MQNVLANHDFVQYYLDHVEHLLSTEFTPAAIATRMGTTTGTGLWQRVSQSAYLEADFPYASPFTGRQFANDEVYRAGYAQELLRHGESAIQGIHHYVRMRSDSAWDQLKALRPRYPSGGSGIDFGRLAERVPADVWVSPAKKGPSSCAVSLPAGPSRLRKVVASRWLSASTPSQ